MIQTITWNLACETGHKFWAPTPFFWFQKQCGHTRTTDGKTVTCRQHLHKSP